MTTKDDIFPRNLREAMPNLTLEERDALVDEFGAALNKPGFVDALECYAESDNPCHLLGAVLLCPALGRIVKEVSKTFEASESLRSSDHSHQINS